MYAAYTSSDCSGTPITSSVEDTFSATNVVSTCSADACPNVVSQTSISSGCADGDLTDAMTYSTISYVADECNVVGAGSTMWTCESGTATLMSYATSTECTGTSVDLTYTANGQVICGNTITSSGTMTVCGAASFTVDTSGVVGYG